MADKHLPARQTPPAALEFKSAQVDKQYARGTRFHFEVITPIFGGGVHLKANKDESHLKDIDRVTPIRAAELKAQLRFWWRAIYGSALGSVAEMRKREAQIFGTAAKVGDPKSPAQGLHVRVRPKDGQTVRIDDVQVFEMGTTKAGNPAVNVKRGAEGVAYGAFPLRPEKPTHNSKPGVLHRVTGHFEITLTFARPSDWVEYGQQVKDAMRCVLTFGAVGGRTRRGFGALADVRPEAPVDPRRLIEEFIAKVPAAKDGPLNLVPTFEGARLHVTARKYDRADDALEAGLSILRDFRQKPDFGRNPGTDDPRRPGRSRWPEPEAIRVMKVSGRPGSARHRERFVNVDKFPRAAFGMPIIFHFKDDREGDPPDTTLRPKNSDRMASPLIIRPFRCTGPNESPKYRVLALYLGVPGRTAEALILKAPDGDHKVDAVLTATEAAKIRPMREVGGGHTDPIRAFLAYFAARTTP